MPRRLLTEILRNLKGFIRLSSNDDRFETPADDATIWRYMDLAKFVATVRNTGLYFSRADCLGDQFEGTFTPASEASFRKAHPGIATNGDWPTIVRSLRNWTYVSCWHVSEDESAALWKLYGDSIAIRSTFGRLKQFLPAGRYDLGLVEYIDYTKDHPDISFSTAPFFYKRRHFIHERELRAVKQIQNYEGGVEVFPTDDEGPDGEYELGRDGVGLQALVEAVVVAPTATDWFRESVFEVSRAFDCSLVCMPSEIQLTPS